MSRTLSLQELQNLNPEDVYIKEPKLDPIWRDHLLWLLDNYPERCLSLFQSDQNELKRLLLRVVQRASLLEAILNEKGELQNDQIKEIVYAKVVSPSESLREPLKPLNDNLKLKILNWSDGLVIPDSLSLYYSMDAGDCTNIRVSKIDLKDFLKNLVIEYQEKLKNDHEEKRSIRNIIETFFDSSNIIMANLANEEDPDSIVEILMFEVIEFYSTDAWDYTEMYINDLSPLDREKIEFSDLIEILRGQCDECS